MKIIANDSVRELVELHHDLIMKFVHENLTGRGTRRIIKKLNINISQCIGDNDTLAGRVTIKKDYWNPKIFLFENGIKGFQNDPRFSSWSFEQIQLYVLFHELTHVTHNLSDVKGNYNFFRSDEFRCYPGEEMYCNSISEQFLWENGFLNGLTLNYFDPQSLIDE